MRSEWLVLLAAVALAGAQPKEQSPESLFKQAVQIETVDGDLGAAMTLYSKIAAAADESLAAKALLRLAQCYDKLGDSRAKQVYERIVRNFAAQTAEADRARRRLAGKTEATPAPVASRELLWAKSAQVRLSISPDGSFAVISRKGNLVRRDLATGEERAITTDAIVESPGFRYARYFVLTPDGKSVVFTWETPDRTDMKIVNVDGAGARTLAQSVSYWPVAISPDQSKALVQRAGNEKASYVLSTFSMSDGAIRDIDTFFPSTGVAATPNAFSPDGRFIVYMKEQNVAQRWTGIAIAKTDGGEIKTLVGDPTGSWGATHAMWKPDGSGIIFRSNRSGQLAIWQMRVSDGVSAGAPELITTGITLPLSLTASGALHYVDASRFQTDVYVADFDPASRKLTSAAARVNQRYIGDTRNHVSWSPDGGSLLYSRSSNGGTFYVTNVATGEEQTVRQSAGAYPQYLQFFPGGESVLALDYVDHKVNFRRVNLQTGEATTVLHRPTQDVWSQPAMSADGKKLYYSQAPNVTGLVPAKLMARDIASGEETSILELTTRGAGLFSISVSPDGNFVSFIILGADSKMRLMVVPSAGGSPRDLAVGANPTGSTAWTKDGRYILYVERSSSPEGAQIMAVPAAGGPPERVGGATDRIASLAVSPNGTRVAFIGTNEGTDLWVARDIVAQQH